MQGPPRWDGARSWVGRGRERDMSESTTNTARAGPTPPRAREFVRDTSYITDRIVAAPQGAGDWPVEPGRYRLVAARACPWASRTLIVRRLLGLEDALSAGLPGPTHDADSWTFDIDPGGVDPVLGIHKPEGGLRAPLPGYPRGITVPAIVEIGSGEVVTNDFDQITRDLASEWTAFRRPAPPNCGGAAGRDGAGDAPGLHRGQQRRLPVASPAARTPMTAYDRLWTALDWLEDGSPAHHFFWSATRSPRPTSDCSPPWSGSTRSHHGHFAATGTSDGVAGAVGLRPATCTRPRASATPSTSCRSSSTTTSSIVT